MKRLACPKAGLPGSIARLRVLSRVDQNRYTVDEGGITRVRIIFLRKAEYPRKKSPPRSRWVEDDPRRSLGHHRVGGKKWGTVPGRCRLASASASTALPPLAPLTHQPRPARATATIAMTLERDPCQRATKEAYPKKTVSTRTTWTLEPDYEGYGRRTRLRARDILIVRTSVYNAENTRHLLAHQFRVPRCKMAKTTIERVNQRPRYYDHNNINTCNRHLPARDATPGRPSRRIEGVSRHDIIRPSAGATARTRSPQRFG